MAGLGDERHNCVWKDCRGPDEYMETCNDCECFFHKSCRADFVCTRLVRHIGKLDEDGLCGEPDCHLRFQEVDTQLGPGEDFSQPRDVGSMTHRDNDRFQQGSQVTAGASVTGVESQGDVICEETLESYEDDAVSGNTMSDLPLGDNNGNVGGGPSGDKGLAHRGSSRMAKVSLVSMCPRFRIWTGSSLQRFSHARPGTRVHSGNTGNG